MTKLDPMRRRTTGPFLLLGILAGCGPFLDPNSYGNPIFEVIWRLAPPKVWGVLWLGVALLSVATYATGRVSCYIGCIVGTMMLSLAWLAAILVGKYQGYNQSLVGIGLWCFVVGACVSHVSIPITYLVVEKEREVH
jgi:hypothetical protein